MEQGANLDSPHSCRLLPCWRQLYSKHAESPQCTQSPCSHPKCWPEGETPFSKNADVRQQHISCLQATSAKHYGEKDARLEYLSWRVWFMKRNRALAKEERRRRAALLAEEGSAVTVQDEEASHDGETSDDETLMPVTSTGSKGISFDLEKKASLHLDKKRAPSLPKVSPDAPRALCVKHHVSLRQQDTWPWLTSSAGFALLWGSPDHLVSLCTPCVGHRGTALP